MGDAMLLLMDVSICLKGADCDCILQEEEEDAEFEIQVLDWLLSSKAHLRKKHVLFSVLLYKHVFWLFMQNAIKRL